MENLLNIPTLLNQHHAFFNTNRTKEVSFRITQLEKLYAAILKYESQINEALKKDLGKSPTESYATEIGFVLTSIKEAKKKLPKWAKDQTVSTPLFLFPSKSKKHHEPYGTVLIIGPFNYPFQLLIEPLIGAISAGNTIVLKPSEMVPTVSTVIQEMIADTFNADYISVIEGGIEANIELLKHPFDYIFFTGSTTVGKEIMKAAAEHLTPVTLELGGKSPALILKDADIQQAAKRILYGKLLNAGQTCVAPDYVLIHKDLKQSFIEECRKVIQQFYGPIVQNSPDFPRIVNERHTTRLMSILEESKDEILFGGHVDLTERYVEPTLLESNWTSPAMKEELFGPLLPIISFDDLDETIVQINKRSKPLALYIFSNDKNTQNKIIHETSSGGVTINNTIFHLVSPNLPFGGVGHSGMGSYHGKYSFMTFSHERSILSSKKVEAPFIFPPYSDNKLKWIRRFLN
ncbi:aldehyde dehydrogenase (NAD+) [Carnobacterium iners]|uniref:Aldehyde dehydrogenase n=1 Tax=Carnobacterium iners TaxID=1073423 RepID=A0A1X7MX21_9LACT|nr:aldehyde dehydrogenase [Carnobacterium iners]SEL33497.1 aldehyde dehydrogenase (NAD+) [Carnobacterium iners]SMH28733.1 aldehyde dehydrogenase (NAD+) [Carnobacterium iners]